MDPDDKTAHLVRPVCHLPVGALDLLDGPAVQHVLEIAHCVDVRAEVTVEEPVPRTIGHESNRHRSTGDDEPRVRLPYRRRGEKCVCEPVARVSDIEIEPV